MQRSMIWRSKHVSEKPCLDLKMTAVVTNTQNGPCASVFFSAFTVQFEKAAAHRGPDGSKQAWRCWDLSLVTLSVYPAVQHAGDSNYQQMTVAVLDAGQMAIPGIARVQLWGGGLALRGPKECGKDHEGIKVH